MLLVILYASVCQWMLAKRTRRAQNQTTHQLSKDMFHQTARANERKETFETMPDDENRSRTSIKISCLHICWFIEIPMKHFFRRPEIQTIHVHLILKVNEKYELSKWVRIRSSFSNVCWWRCSRSSSSIFNGLSFDVGGLSRTNWTGAGASGGDVEDQLSCKISTKWVIPEDIFT